MHEGFVKHECIFKRESIYSIIGSKRIQSLVESSAESGAVWNFGPQQSQSANDN